MLNVSRSGNPVAKSDADTDVKPDPAELAESSPRVRKKREKKETDPANSITPKPPATEPSKADLTTRPNLGDSNAPPAQRTPDGKGGWTEAGGPVEDTEGAKVLKALKKKKKAARESLPENSVSPGIAPADIKPPPKAPPAEPDKSAKLTPKKPASDVALAKPDSYSKGVVPVSRPETPKPEEATANVGEEKPRKSKSKRRKEAEATADATANPTEGIASVLTPTSANLEKAPSKAVLEVEKAEDAPQKSMKKPRTPRADAAPTAETAATEKIPEARVSKPVLPEKDATSSPVPGSKSQILRRVPSDQASPMPGAAKQLDTKTEKVGPALSSAKVVPEAAGGLSSKSKEMLSRPPSGGAVVRPPSATALAAPPTTPTPAPPENVPAGKKDKRKKTVEGEPETKEKKPKKKKQRKSTLNPIEEAAIQEGKKRVRRRTKLLEAELADAGIKVAGGAGKSDELYGMTVGNFFMLEDVLGKGGFGEARRGRHVVSNKKFAIKLERVADGNDSLSEEYRIYQIIGQHMGFPRCYYFGVGPKEHNALVMDLLGPSLEDYFRAMERKWTLKMVCMVAIQVLDRIEYLHSKGYVYSDVKPENFLVGLAEEHQDSLIFLIDFGLAQQFKDKDTGKYCYDENMKTHPIGTMRYMSVRSHEGRSLSYRDDLESIGYLIIYLIRGRLPWQGTSIKDRLKKVKAVGMHKKNITMDDLCKDCPQEMQDYMKYVRSIQFYAEPRYEKLRTFFINVLTSHEWVDDGKFDWMGKSFDFAKNKKSDSGIHKTVPSGEKAEEAAAPPVTVPPPVAVPPPPAKADKTPEPPDPAADAPEESEAASKKVKKKGKKGAGKKGRKKSSVPDPAAALASTARKSLQSASKADTKKEEVPKVIPPPPGTDMVIDPIQSYNEKGHGSSGNKAAKETKQKGLCGCC